MAEAAVVPPGPYRLPGPTRDRVTRERGGVLERLLHVDGRPALVRAWAAGGSVRLHAEAADRDGALAALGRMRFALGVDHDLTDFRRAFARDRLLGPLIARRPWLRPRRRPVAFEALAWAVSEQLIDGARAVGIQRSLVARHGPRGPLGLRDVPGAGTVAALAPAECEACGLSPRRAIVLVRAAREVASGRADLDAAHERSWMRLRAIPGIGPWTVECLAFHGQGRDDQLPAGDLAYLEVIGRLLRLGRRATEDEVREFFAPYAPFAALAGMHVVRAAHSGGLSL